MAPKKKGGKKQQADDWENDLGEMPDPIAAGAEQAKAAVENLATAKLATEKTPAETDLIAACDTAEKESESAAEKDKLAAETRAAADKAAREASEQAREADAKKAAAADRAKAAKERAKPRDVTVTVYSVPITIQVKAEEKK